MHNFYLMNSKSQKVKRHDNYYLTLNNFEEIINIL